MGLDAIANLHGELFNLEGKLSLLEVRYLCSEYQVRRRFFNRHYRRPLARHK